MKIHNLVADAEHAMAKAKEMKKELLPPAPVAKKTIMGSPPPALSEAGQERELKHKLEQSQTKTLATLTFEPRHYERHRSVSESRQHGALE
jgi:hypothetical protein